MQYKFAILFDLYDSCSMRVTKVLFILLDSNWQYLYDFPIFCVCWMQYSLVNSREERKSLYSVLFDYVLHQINETCIATGVNEYTDDEIQPLAALLAQTNAAEAFYISVKLGVEGIGELLRRSIASALSRYPNSERLNTVFSSLSFKIVGMIVL